MTDSRARMTWAAWLAQREIRVAAKRTGAAKKDKTARILVGSKAWSIDDPWLLGVMAVWCGIQAEVEAALSQSKNAAEDLPVYGKGCDDSASCHFANIAADLIKQRSRSPARFDCVLFSKFGARQAAEKILALKQADPASHETRPGPAASVILGCFERHAKTI